MIQGPTLISRRAEGPVTAGNRVTSPKEHEKENGSDLFLSHKALSLSFKHFLILAKLFLIIPQLLV